MAERITVNSKKPVSIKENLISHKRKTDFRSNSSPVNRILYLQRTIGNQAVQRMVRSGALQAKLSIGQPGDKYEQEADRVADAVMRMPEPGVQREVEPEEEEELQAKPLAEEITPLVQRQVEPEEEEEAAQAKFLQKQEEETAQAKGDGGNFPAVSTSVESGINTIRGGGSPLPESSRAFFEPRFGADFSGVKVHTDSNAAHLSRSVNAKAFTLGRDVVFGAGQYAPESSIGKQLLAHELTHFVQQRGAQCIGKFKIQRVKLTYDDGPDTAGNTSKILEILKKTGAKATFYVVGQKVIEGDKWRTVFNIAASGSWLGNHAFDWSDKTDNHIFLNGPSKERARKILITEWAIRDALIMGKNESIDNDTWKNIPQAHRNYINDVIKHGTGRFRTPGFKSKWWRSDDKPTIGALLDVNRILASAGLRTYEVSDEVDVDPKDWQKGKGQADIVKATKEGLDDVFDDDSDDSILLHSRVAASVAATPEIISFIKKKGWSFEKMPRGKTGKFLPKAGFANLSTITDPPTKAQIRKAKDFLFNNPQYGGWLLGEVAVGIYNMASRLGEREVLQFSNDLDTTLIKVDKCHYYAATCLSVNDTFRLLHDFIKIWVSKKVFPKTDRTLRGY